MAPEKSSCDLPMINRSRQHNNTRYINKWPSGKRKITPFILWCQRVSLHGDIAEKCANMCEEYALLSLWLTFGGSPCPHEFCIYSELSADLANDLLHCPAWNPKKLCSPHSSTLLEPVLLPSLIPFSPARNLDAVMEPDDWGKVEIFIDDGIVITPDLHSNRDRAVPSLLLAIHTLCHPTDPSEPIA
jgi:hypothetical protein